MPSFDRTENVYLGYKLDTNGNVRVHESTSFRKRGFMSGEPRYGYPHLLGKADVGGAFTSEQLVQEVSPSHMLALSDSSGQLQYHGRMAASLPPDYRAFSPTTISLKGPAAYNRMKPAKPSFDAATTLGELKDTPQLIGHLRDNLRDQGRVFMRRHDYDSWLRQQLRRSGSDYLNVVFGWAPIIRSIRDLVETSKKTSKRVDWLIRNNGKPVRTSCKLGEDSYSWTGGYPNSYGFTFSLVNQMYAGPPSYRDYIRAHRKQYGTGRFRYYLPEPQESPEYRAALTRALYGLDVTASTLYNLMPWSWLIDWFTNVGDNISNLDAGVADRCAADWVYVMEETVNQTIRNATVVCYRLGGGTIKVDATTTQRYSYKQRVSGSPFGFDIKGESLSLMQGSILGALGLSKLR